MEIVIVAVLIVGVLIYNKTIDKDKFIKDNAQYFDLLREDDYNFLVMAKYGDKVDSDVLFQKRVILGIVTIFVVMFVSMNSLSLLNILLAVVIGFLAFKYPYMGLKNYYKKHLHNIDVMLPYYLKGLEILIQHYTVPVAIGKSIEDAPDLFKPGLRNMIEKINAGDSTIQPYMDFANEYPVRDSMRMMRLLYRLGINACGNWYQCYVLNRNIFNENDILKKKGYKLLIICYNVHIVGKENDINERGYRRVKYDSSYYCPNWCYNCFLCLVLATSYSTANSKSME